MDLTQVTSLDQYLNGDDDEILCLSAIDVEIGLESESGFVENLENDNDFESVIDNDDEQEICWGLDFTGEDVYVNYEDDYNEEEEVTIPLCWDSLQLQDRVVTVSDEFDWEEVNEGLETPIISLEELAIGETGNRGWEVLLNAHTLEINFDAETREVYIVGDHNDDYIHTTEYEMLFEQFAEGEVSNVGLLPPTSESFVNNLPTVLVEAEKGDDGVVVCAVCKDEMEIGTKAVKLPCNHKYHGECIVPWLSVRNTCPVCRYDLPTDDAEYERRKSLRTTTTHGFVL